MPTYKCAVSNYDEHVFFFKNKGHGVMSNTYSSNTLANDDSKRVYNFISLKIFFYSLCSFKVSAYKNDIYILVNYLNSFLK